MPNPLIPAALQEIIDTHKALFGGFEMMADEAPSGDGQPNPAPAGNPAADDHLGDEGKGGKAAVLADLAKERDERQKLQKEMEALKPLQDQMKRLVEAFGEPKKEGDAQGDLVAQLQAQMAQLQHGNLVAEIARTSKITDDDDIELLRTATDREQMEKLAKRLAKDPGGKPGTPRSDPSVGRGGGDDSAKTSTVSAGRDLYRDRHKK